MKEKTIEIRVKTTPELHTYYYVFVDNIYVMLYLKLEEAEAHIKALKEAFNEGRLEFKTIYSELLTENVPA
jgi:hypothetical protein